MFHVRNIDEKYLQFYGLVKKTAEIEIKLVN